ncbi:MAG: fumarylacetoacetate hydrolase family protein [Gammaproteobacteria bacterium]|jgi:fumarylpyruvate hydrolase
MTFIFPGRPQPAVAISGQDALFPVNRIYCVGKNYAAHIREMGAEASRDAVCFFLKPADALVTDGRMPYPPGTANLHFEGELVIAIGKGGANIPAAAALDHVFGYAAGLDMTRRDLQLAAGRVGHPWDTGKAFDGSAPVSPIVPVAQCGHFARGSLKLWVNGLLRQDADFGDLIWKNHEVISELSKLYTLQAGDLIFTGTPAGVGPVVAGDRIELCIDRLNKLEVLITAS